jgi:hypothetical protein
VSCLEEDNRILRTHALFEPHRISHLETLFPVTSRTNLLSKTEVDCWTEDPTLLSKLFELLPFGQALLSDEYNDFIENTLPRIPNGVQDQFLYWHLATPPTSTNQPIESTPSGKPSNVNLELFLMIFDNPNNEHIFSRNHSKS